MTRPNQTTPRPATAPPAAPRPEVPPVTAPAFDFSKLTVVDVEPIVITRVRKARELSALGAALRQSHQDGKTKAVTVPTAPIAETLVRDLRADAKQLDIGMSVRSDKQADGTYLVRFLGKTKRNYTTTK